MNAKQYREQRDEACRKRWRAEGALKDILNYIGPTSSPDCFVIRKMVQDYFIEVARG